MQQQQPHHMRQRHQQLSPQQSTDSWFYLDSNGQEFGPTSTRTMRELFAAGNFPPGRELLVRMAHWATTASVGELYLDREPFDGPPCMGPNRPSPYHHHGPPQMEAWTPNRAVGFDGGVLDHPSVRAHPVSRHTGCQMGFFNQAGSMQAETWHRAQPWDNCDEGDGMQNRGKARNGAFAKRSKKLSNQQQSQQQH